MQLLKLGRHTISITHTSKELFPKSRITKGDIIHYYLKIADVMLPHMKNRPITMQRFPEGIASGGFYQKDSADYFPAWIKYVSVKKKSEGSVRYVICNDEATLLYLANQYCLTFHLWLSKKDKLNYPDRLIFDLDAQKKDFDVVKKTAFILKDALESLSLVPFVMLTGSRGVHVVVPLKRRYTFDEVRAFGHDVAQLLVDKYPHMLTLEVRKEKRRGRVFLDILRNAFGQTGVAPYAVRAIEGAPVATPISWEELKKSTMHAQRYTIKTILQRLARTNDPWVNIDRYAQTLVRARKELARLMKDKHSADNQ